jgi:diguanylate cyclase (GGDEF)-like protein
VTDSTSDTRGRAVLARDQVAASRALALFAGAGGLWVLMASITVPGFAGPAPMLALSIAVGAMLVVIALAAWFGAARTPPRLLAAVAPLSVLVVGALNLATSDSSTGSQLFLLWPVLYAASFLSRRHTVLVLVQVMAVEALVMGSLQPTERALIDTLSLVLAFTMAAFAVLTFRARVDVLLAAVSAQAREDPMTGLPNRRAFDDHLQRLVAASGRSGDPLSLLLIDVDRFKDVNDTRGHMVGDQVLRAVAGALRASGREADIVARIGGDEFAVLLPACSLEDALPVGAAAADRAAARTARIGAPVTVSVGTATLPTGAQTAAELFAAADRALYASKHEGRAPVPGEVIRPG